MQQNKSARTSTSSSARKENGGHADPSPTRVRKLAAGTERPAPLSPNGAKAATAPQQSPEAAAAAAPKPAAASGASAPRPYWPRATPHGDSEICEVLQHRLTGHRERAGRGRPPLEDGGGSHEATKESSSKVKHCRIMPKAGLKQLK